MCEMNYPAASHGVSKARQQYENHLEASFFGVWTRGAIKRGGYARVFQLDYLTVSDTNIAPKKLIIQGPTPNPRWVIGLSP